MVKSLIVCLIAVSDPDLAIRGEGGGRSPKKIF